MSIYEKHYHYVVGSCSCYTDSLAEALDAVLTEGVTRVDTGYADDEWVDVGHPLFGGIAGTLYTRRTDGSLDLSTVGSTLALVGGEE